MWQSIKSWWRGIRNLLTYPISEELSLDETEKFLVMKYAREPYIQLGMVLWPEEREKLHQEVVQMKF